MYSVIIYNYAYFIPPPLPPRLFYCMLCNFYYLQVFTKPSNPVSDVTISHLLTEDADVINGSSKPIRQQLNLTM